MELALLSNFVIWRISVSLNEWAEFQLKVPPRKRYKKTLHGHRSTGAVPYRTVSRQWIEMKIHWRINFYLKTKLHNAQRWLKHQIKEKTEKEIIQASRDKEWKHIHEVIFLLFSVNNNCRETLQCLLMFGFLSEEPFLIKIICFLEIQYVEISGAFMITFKKTLRAGGKVQLDAWSELLATP